MIKLKTTLLILSIMLFLGIIFIYHNEYNKMKINENELYTSLERLIYDNYIYENAIELEVYGQESVVINGRIWMKENLNTTHYANGDPILEIKETKKWQKAKTGAWCNFNNDPKYGEVYGKLYNWYAVNDPRGLCPRGWRVASIDDWRELIEFYGGKYLSVIALKSNNGWSSKGGKNQSKLAVLPGGYRPTPTTSENGKDFDGLTGAVYWSATTTNNTFLFLNKTALGIDIGHDYIYFATNAWYVGQSVRCVTN